MRDWSYFKDLEQEERAQVCGWKEDKLLSPFGLLENETLDRLKFGP